MDLKGGTVTGGASGIGRATAAKAGVAGTTDTPLFQRQPERIKEALTRAIPFRRIARPPKSPRRCCSLRAAGRITSPAKC